MIEIAAESDALPQTLSASVRVFSHHRDVKYLQLKALFLFFFFLSLCQTELTRIFNISDRILNDIYSIEAILDFFFLEFLFRIEMIRQSC